MDWLTKKINERTSWDGGAMIALGHIMQHGLL
jgi:hypothetical protein